jgi:hypothetical protein
MFRRLLAGVAAAVAVTSLTVVVPASAVPVDAPAESPVQIQEQVLNWTSAWQNTYTSAPTTAKAGVTKIVFENSTRTGNDQFVTHTLTFDQSTPGYNHDVKLNINANPIDPQQGYHEATVTLAPGKYRFYCEIQGHQITMFGEFTVVPDGPDETPPTVSADVTGTKDTNGNYVGKATVKVNASDAGSGVDKVEYQVRDLSWQPYTAPFDITEPGDYSVQYRATDKAGNVSPEGSVQFKVVAAQPDSTPPTVTHEVTGTKDPQGNYIGKATVAINATDTESGVDKTEYKVDSGAWTTYTAPFDLTTAGMHMVHYRASDKAGNVSPEGMAHVTIVTPDTTPPVVTAAVAGDKDPNGNYRNKATVTITATDEGGTGVKTTEYSLDGGAWTTYTTPVEVTAAGAHTIRHRATDNSNNTSPEGSTSFTVVTDPVDTTAPTVDALITGTKDPQGNYVESALVTINATDTQSGVKTTEYQLDSGAWTVYNEPFSVTARGAHTVNYRATDVAGNTSPAGMKNFTVVDPPNPDTTPPTVTSAVSGDKDPNGNYIGSATVALTATDTESGVDKVEYSLDGAAFTRYSTPVRVTTNGAHTVRYRATDVAGNTSPEGTASFTIVTAQPDTTPPTVSTSVSGNKDPNGNYVDSATVTVTATDNQSGVKTTEYSVDNGAWTAYSVPVRVGTSGQHTVQARATVIIDGDDTRVANVDAGRGCTINDLIDETGSYADHPAFVRHVEQVTDSLVTASLINVREQGAIVRAAARSDIGK